MPHQTNNEARRVDGLFSYTKQVWNTALDWIFPPRCIHCGRVDSHFCAACLRDLATTPIERNQQHIEPLDGLIATGVHDGVLQSAVQALKYHSRREMAMPLAQRMKTIIGKNIRNFDILIPVPLHTTRQRQRGYNQANELAQALSAITDVPTKADSLLRQRYTPSQVGLNRQQRQANVQDAFIADEADVRNKVVLLIDDVQTTGATIAACADAAQHAGAKAVYGITVTAARLQN